MSSQKALLALGPVAAEIAMAVLYALAVLCWWRVGRSVGVAPGIVLAALVLAYPGYVLLFHRLASDALYAAAFALAALLTARLVESRTPGRAAAVGLGLALLVLIRPVSLVLVVLAPLLLLARDAWRPRLAALVSLGVALAVPLVVWAGHNALRADDFTVVRGAGTGSRSTARSSSTGSSRPRTETRHASSPERSPRICCRASRTARTRSTSTRSSAPAARACTRT